ncbi:copper uptake system-associated protein [Pseudomonas sp. 21LCFQ010]|uniref:copper uptake system-associated protein n=1 Tax=Pseudomonas sp. 21LCFQ010 TaxID=2957506 RepID=UPI0020982C56|nr:copper uptake system-associated protein [Pseudomonas sp. 21LCFQ010]MCO8166032.1 copper uptake system-associated protein [Pseudomonas sp. 21LCFQ010]
MKWIVTLTLLVAMTSPVLMASPETDQQSIARTMKLIWDRPDSPLQVEPVTIEGDHAVAGWTQQQRGGRALLRRKGSGWSIVLCAGDSLLNADTLRKAGLDEAQATALVKNVREAEARLPAERMKQFALFQGVVKMDAQHGQKPAGH